ncbi:hypothetical protein D3C86_1347700 [compost metagenome]
MLGRIGQGLADVDVVVGALGQLGIHPGVAAEDLPLVGDIARDAQFQALNLGLAGLLIDACGHLDLSVLAHGLEQGAAEGQAVVEQVGLGADLEALGLLRVQQFRQAASGQAVARVLVAGRDGRRRRGGGPGGVEAAVGRRLVDQADLIVDEVPVAAARGQGRNGGRADVHPVRALDRIVVPAQAEVQNPLFAERHRVEGVETQGVGRVVADVAARDRAGPRVVRIGGIDRGAVEARQGRRAGRAGQGGDIIAGVAVLLARQLQTQVEVVLDRAGQE